MSADRMLQRLVAGLAEKADAQELERHLWSGAKWVRGQVDAGKAQADLDDVIEALVPRAVSSGLLDEAKARRQVERGWSWASGGQKKPTGSLSALRPVQHGIAAAAKPMDVPQAVELLLGVISDARIRNKLAGIVMDCLDVHHVATQGTKGDAA